jgi:hypothetical protein
VLLLAAGWHGDCALASASNNKTKKTILEPVALKNSASS